MNAKDLVMRSATVTAKMFPRGKEAYKIHAQCPQHQIQGFRINWGKLETSWRNKNGVACTTCELRQKCQAGKATVAYLEGKNINS